MINEWDSEKSIYEPNMITEEELDNKLKIDSIVKPLHTVGDIVKMGKFDPGNYVV